MSYTLQLPLGAKPQRKQMKYASQSVDDLIRMKWPKLADEEIRNYRLDPRQFYSALQQTYNITQEEIELQLNLIKRKVIYAAA
ncbi:MAG TPA: hypothetical protein VFT64_09715 [Rickettsiales bacterium]|nr:hypothetical protein [Rickettsiales bacterium]